MSGGGAERRLNLLTGDWVLVSPHRLQRPWQGETEPAANARAPAHDPACYLCPGNRRAEGQVNPDYRRVFVFDNDFPALLPPTPEAASSDPLLVRAPEHGVCRVICYSPDHGQTMAHMPPEAIRRVIDVWAEQTVELGALPGIEAVTIFENRGAMMGASNPHPHGQVWATSSVPNELKREFTRQRAWLERTGEPLLEAYMRRERASGERLVLANDHMGVVTPYWAMWPFETLIAPWRRAARIDALSGAERDGLADVLSRLTRAYDRLFDAPFPYTLGLHQLPSKAEDDGAFGFHIHIYPPLLRSATVRKHMVGFEMLAMPQRDLTPEQAAERIKEAAERD
jgi:UDPglucose--hexose-1-phosphate uridylyltransferase